MADDRPRSGRPSLIAASSVCTKASLGLAVLAFAILCWRSLLPSNRHRELDLLSLRGWPDSAYFWTTATTFEESVTRVTSRNFARDGFWRTHFLANRQGMPLLSYYDESRTQCESPSKPQHVLTYTNPRGEPSEMVSLNNECIYTHYPPLADWVFGALAALGIQQFSMYRCVALALNCCLLVALYFWLRREVTERAALATLGITATLPAFFRWADALFYHSMQYLFLVAGMLTWGRYLRRRETLWFIATFGLYFCEAFASYQLTVFFGTMLVGMVLLQRRPIGLREFRDLGLQLVAPVMAAVLQLALRLSLMGPTRTWDNLARTVHARIGSHPLPLIDRNLLIQVRTNLLRLDLTVLALVATVAVYTLNRMPLWRPLALLACLILGGMSFGLMFPETTAGHFWMMYRHFMPACVFLMALTVESLLVVLPWAAGFATAGRVGPRHRVVAALLGLLCATPLAWSAYRNGFEILRDVRANRLLTPTAPANLVNDYLDVLQWTEAGTAVGNSWPFVFVVDGIRARPRPNPNLVYQVQPGVVSYHEIWWLEPKKIGSVRLLTEEAFVADLREHCELTLFDEKAFQPFSVNHVPTTYPFQPGTDERASGEPRLRWIDYSLDTPGFARAIRLKCLPVPRRIPIHELEVQ